MLGGEAQLGMGKQTTLISDGLFQTLIAGNRKLLLKACYEELELFM